MNTNQSTTSNRISQTNWQLHYVDSEQPKFEATKAFDGNQDTAWNTNWNNGDHPHDIAIDLGATYTISGFAYLPRQDGSPNGTIKDFEFYVSNGGDWGSAVSKGTWAWENNNYTEKEETFSSVTGRYIRLRALSEILKEQNPGRIWTTVADINVIGHLSTLPHEGNLKDCPGVDIMELQ